MMKIQKVRFENLEEAVFIAYDMSVEAEEEEVCLIIQGYRIKISLSTAVQLANGLQDLFDYVDKGKKRGGKR